MKDYKNKTHMASLSILLNNFSGSKYVYFVNINVLNN